MYRVATQRPQWHTQNFEGLLNSSSFLIKFCDLSHLASLLWHQVLHCKSTTTTHRCQETASQGLGSLFPMLWLLLFSRCNKSTRRPKLLSNLLHLRLGLHEYHQKLPSSHQACLLCQEAHRHWCLRQSVIPSKSLTNLCVSNVFWCFKPCMSRFCV